MKELYLTDKQNVDLIRAFDSAHPNPGRTIFTQDILEWIEEFYHCKMISEPPTVSLVFHKDKDLTFFLLKHPC